MNIFNQTKILPNLLMNKISSVFLASDSFLSSLASTDGLVQRLLRFILQIVYFACKWLMYIVDVIYFYILQLAGISADTSIFDSGSSDMTFRMIIDNKETVTTIIKNFIVIAILLIIVTAVIAIIKQQANAFKEKKAKKNATLDVLKSMFKSFILIILTPLISILGIVASSVLLQTLFNATNLSDTKSLSARVFNAAASSANRYRSYAEAGVRIPITFKFSGDKKNDAINYTANMLGNSKFPSFSYFSDKNSSGGSKFLDPVFDTEVSGGQSGWINDTYYAYYDSSSSYGNKSLKENDYKIIETHVNEYYAMSDVICYALDTMEPYYFVTIQELLEKTMYGTDGKQTFSDLVDGYNIRLLNANGAVLNEGSYDGMYTTLKNGNYNYIRYTSTYADKTYTYIHIKDAVDELEGAKFVIAYKLEYGSSYSKNLNGESILVDGKYEEVEKFYYKDSGSSRYKKVDLLYKYNETKNIYEKATTYSSSETYFYKIGETYYYINGSNKDNFYYKKQNGEYVNYAIGTEFYSSAKDYYFMPLANGVKVNNNPTFTSIYIQPSNLITARGIFDTTNYPTAIRRLSNGNILFYRDDLEIVSEGSLNDVGKIEEIEAESDELNEEDKEDQNIFEKIGSGIKSAWGSVKKFVTDLFNPLKLVPDLKLDPSAMSTTYTNKTKSVFELENGEMQLSYFFSDSLTSKLTKDMFGMNLNTLFEPLAINYVILIVGTLIFFNICSTAVFELIKRSFNLFLMILIYPLACATIPYDDSNKKAKTSAYKNWSKKYTEILFSTYGLILGMNFVFLLIPVIDSIEFISAENLRDSLGLTRIATVLYSPTTLLGITSSPNYNLIARFMNLILRIIFEIVAFSLIASVDGKGPGETYYSAIQKIIGTGPSNFDGNTMKTVKNTLKTMTFAFNMVFFPQKAVKSIIEKSKSSLGTVVKNLPGSALVREKKLIKDEMETKKTQDSAKEDLVNAIKSKAEKSVVDAKLQAFKTAYKIK